MATTNEILEATTAATFRDRQGNVVVIRKGDTIHAGHPLLLGREHMFRPLAVKFAVPVQAAVARRKPRVKRPKSK